MIAHAIFFYTFSIIAVVSAIMVTASKNTVHSVFFLILDFISISCLFIMIGAEFLGMIMLIVYVGAVAVLFLFVVMMLNVAQQKNQWFAGQATSKHIPVGLIISTLIFFEIIIVIACAGHTASHNLHAIHLSSPFGYLLKACSPLNLGLILPFSKG